MDDLTPGDVRSLQSVWKYGGVTVKAGAEENKGKLL